MLFIANNIFKIYIFFLNIAVGNKIRESAIMREPSCQDQYIKNDIIIKKKKKRKK